VAITFVQSGSLTGSNGLSLAFSSNNAAGNCLIVAVMANTNASFVVSDTQGNVYQQLAALAVPLSSIQMQIFYVTSSRAGANTVSFNPGTTTVSALAIHEFSAASSFDVSASAASSGFSVDSGPATTTAASELIFGYIAGQGTSLTSLTEGAGFTRGEGSVFATNTVVFLTEYQIVNSTGSYDATGTMSVGKGRSLTWSAEVATFGGIPGSSGGSLFLMGVGA